MKNTRLQRVGGLLLLVAVILTSIALSLQKPVNPIRIGVLHSLTGTMAASEQYEVAVIRAMVNATNRQGGVLGRPLEMILADGQSDPETFAKEAETLLRDRSVSVIFGCWLSSSRQAVKPIIERYDSLLMYPVQYEGLEQSKHIIYAGSTPNQQLFPALTWARQAFGTKLFLVGSDYTYPRSLSFIINVLGPRIGLEVVGEHYAELGNQEFDSLPGEILASGADFVINTLNGDSNTGFFHSMDKGYQQHADRPLPAVISLSLDEISARALPNLQGHSYLSWSYFYSPQHWTSLEEPIVQDALANELAGQPVSAPMLASIINFMLWRNTVEHIGTDHPKTVNANIRVHGLRWPSGNIFVDSETGNLYQPNFIARHSTQTTLDIVQAFDLAIPPEPYPLGLSRTEWEHAKHEASID